MGLLSYLVRPHSQPPVALLATSKRAEGLASAQVLAFSPPIYILLFFASTKPLDQPEDVDGKGQSPCDQSYRQKRCERSA